METSNAELKATVKEKYGNVALRVVSGEPSSCCGSSGCCGSTAENWDPITADLYDAGQAERGVPIHASDADRIRAHDGRLARFVRREIKQTMLSEADDDAFARTVRKNVARGDEHFGAPARQPGIDVRIGSDDFFVADAVPAADIEQRVFLRGHHFLNFADHRVGAHR